MHIRWNKERDVTEFVYAICDRHLHRTRAFFQNVENESFLGSGVHADLFVFFQRSLLLTFGEHGENMPIVVVLHTTYTVYAEKKKAQTK